LFGEQLSFVKTTYFDKRFYDMILAIQNDKWVSGSVTEINLTMI
jgi:hypothetical protein